MEKREPEEISEEEIRDFVEGDDLIRTWLAGLAETTAYKYARTLIRYTRFYDLTPKQLLEVKKRGGEKAEGMLDYYIVNINLTESAKRNDVIAIHSFYSGNYLDLASKSGYSKVRYVKVMKYKCPTQEELREEEYNAHIRDKAIINLLSSGGFRVGTAVKLVWGDLYELWDFVKDEAVWDGVTNVHIGIESRRLKGEGYEGVEQHTFLTRYACDVLLKYAEWYSQRREITPDAPLLISRSASGGHGAFTALEDNGIRQALKKLGPYTPHDFRRFHETQLEASRINPNWIKKMQGKKLRGEDNPYSRPKIEQLRRAFKDAEQFLTLEEPRAVDMEKMRIETALDSLRLAGRTEAEIETVRELLMGKPANEAVREIPLFGEALSRIFEREGWDPSESHLIPKSLIDEEIERIKRERERRRREQRIVSEDDLSNHLSHGWRVAAVLPSGRIVVEREV